MTDDDNMGYEIGYTKCNRIFTKFWAFTNDGVMDEIKNVRYVSLNDLYEKSKIFVNSSLINYSLLHKSRYKMMCDFIEYYENSSVTLQ
jgi:hypothetical protein